MNTAILKIHDEVNCSFEGLPPEIRRVLNAKSKIFNPSLRFTPAVRLGRWDGKTPYFSIGGSTYINLLPSQIEYIAEQGWEITIEDTRTYNRSFDFSSVDKDYVAATAWPIGHQLAGQPVVLRDHQVEAINKFLENMQGIMCLPTGSGKSLITAILSQKIEKYGRSIVIVPNKDLITQTEEYYTLLGLDVGVYYGDRKDFFKTHTICTWQSLEKLRQNAIDCGLEEPVTFKKFMQGVVAVIVDECHGVKAEKLSDILTKELAHVPIRWALSGTIPKELHEVVNLTIAIGDIIHTLATVDLQDIGVLSDCNVKILQLIDTQMFKDYHAEYEFLVSSPERLGFISKLIRAASESGNVLVLVGRKETGKQLEELIPDSIFLSGATDSKTRKEHYNEVKTSNSKVIIATAGIAAVGIDVPRINHLFLIESGKSFVRTIQSVGRALRTSFDKVNAQIWDICSSCKYSKKHLTERKRYYREQQFPFTIEKINWS